MKKIVWRRVHEPETLGAEKANRAGLATREDVNEDVILQLAGDYSETTFPFEKLPPEIRNMIYGMALVSDAPVHLPLMKSVQDFSIAERFETLRARRPGHDYDERAYRAFKMAARGNNISPAFLPEFDNPMEAYHKAKRHVESECKAYNSVLVLEWMTIRKDIYGELHDIVYGKNVFLLNVNTGVNDLLNLRQCSRSQIRHVACSIAGGRSASQNLQNFFNLLQRGLRYCFGLKSLTVTLPGDLVKNLNAPTSKLTDAFRGVSWLPLDCKVKLKGNMHEIVVEVLLEEGRLDLD